MNKAQGKHSYRINTFIVPMILTSGFLMGSVSPVLASSIQTKAIPSRIHAVSNEILGQMRGGFSVAGMDFTLGISNATFVNGQLLVQNIIRTVGNSLISSTTSNSFNGLNGATVVSSSGNTSGGSSSNNSIVPVRSTSIGGPGSNNIPGITVTSQKLSGPSGGVSFAIQISPTNGAFKNFIFPSSFSGAQGIISILQNTASNLAIHNVVNLDATVANVGSVSHTLTLNNMLSSTMLLHR